MQVIAIFGLSIALLGALWMTAFDSTRNAIDAELRLTNATGLLATHHAAKRFAALNPSALGIVNASTLGATIAPGFDRQYEVNLTATGVRTWALDVTNGGAIIAEVSELHQGAINIGIVQSGGGWRPSNTTTIYGDATHTAGVPVNSVMVFSAR